MELIGQRPLPIDRATAWAALNDPAVLKDCIPGCQSIERVGDDQFSLTIAAALGPVRATFRGKLKVEDVVAPESYALRFEGEGGASGFAKGVAKVRLTEDGIGTRMDYSANAQVGGKLAQVGNRLVDSAARKLAEDFFTAFEKRVTPTSPEAAATSPAAVPPAQVSDAPIPPYLIASAIAVAIVVVVSLLS